MAFLSAHPPEESNSLAAKSSYHNASYDLHYFLWCLIMLFHIKQLWCIRHLRYSPPFDSKLSLSINDLLKRIQQHDFNKGHQ